MDPTIRLRIATRIHFALLRHYGEHVDVAGLLRGDADAREALWVCEASGHAELVSLAQQFNTANEADARRARRASRSRPAVSLAERSAPQDAAWAQDTSGFGVSRSAEPASAVPRAPAATGWLSPARGLRRAAGR